MDLFSIMEFSSKTYSLFCQLPMIEVTQFYPCPYPLVLHVVDINGSRYVRTEDIRLNDSYIRKFASQGYLPFLWLRFGRNGGGVFTTVDNAISSFCIENGKGNKCNDDNLSVGIKELLKIKALKDVCSASLSSDQINVCHNMYIARRKLQDNYTNQ